MSDRPFATPLLIQKGEVRSLERVEFQDNIRDEDWLQQLLYEHPELVPFEELDPPYRKSIPLAREVESGSGPIDIVYANGDGLLTLIETKLWRNPESRREVVAQIINYAAQLTKMSYEEFAGAIAYAEGAKPDCLVKKMRAGAKYYDERHFHDALSRNLKQGRFLLLIVGDGIREDVDSMREFLHRQPMMGYTLRLVEMAIYRLSPSTNDEILILPQIIAKTSEVVRAIVEIHGDRVTVETPPEIKESSGGRRRMTPEQFFVELGKEETPETVNAAKAVVDSAAEHSLTVHWMQGGPVFKYVNDEKGVFFTLGQFDRYGELSELSRFSNRCEELNLPKKIWVDYFEEITRLIPGASRRHFRSKAGNEWDDVVYDVKANPLESLMARRGEWLAAVDMAIKGLREALEKRTIK